MNDNLIGFYFRFLEHHVELTRPQLAKRIYFFNSYFFNTLTNTTKGKRGINYDGVKKWTRTVNIYDCDYVVIPINENAHWYMAIICNLPHLTSGSPEEEPADGEALSSCGDDATKGVQDGSVECEEKSTLNSPLNEAYPGSGSGSEKNTTKSLKKMTLSDEEWPDPDENEPSRKWTFAEPSTPTNQQSDSEYGTKLLRSGPTKLQPIKKDTRKSRSSQRKLDLKQPTIITFDSLNCPRSATHRILREYLEEEGKTKLSLDVDTKRIIGMNAKQIPLQSNFSDCGLYLLAYLERFIRDPDEFVGKLLKKEMREHDDWPPMESRVLRRRLRTFLLRLYDEQEGLEKDPENTPMVAKSNHLRIMLHDKQTKTSESKAEKTRPQSNNEDTESKSEDKKLQTASTDEQQPTEDTNINSTPKETSPSRATSTKQPLRRVRRHVTPENKTRPSSNDNFMDELEDIIGNGVAGENTGRVQSPVVNVPGTPPNDEKNANSNEKLSDSGPTTRLKEQESSDSEIVSGI